MCPKNDESDEPKKTEPREIENAGPKSLDLKTLQQDSLHLKAMDAGQSYYLDPETGLRVMTARSLFERGYCCKTKCRHCPYEDLNRYAPYLKGKNQK